MSTTDTTIHGRSTEYVHRLYEDGGGGLWMVPAGETRAIEMLEDGDWLTDARSYGDAWDIRDAEADGMVREAGPQGELIAWLDVRGEVHEGPECGVEERSQGEPLAGAAGRRYLGIDDPGSDTYRGEG